MPLALECNIGVIAKRPVANVAWRNGNRPPNDSYDRPYWERLMKLQYDFLEGGLKEAVTTALRFTLSVPGVHTAIVGTIKPGRFAENSAAVLAGALPKDRFDSIRARWQAIADRHWEGQT
jgi:aryl-alcohol dehydrogenase-like predicted oxidoreductase